MTESVLSSSTEFPSDSSTKTSSSNDTHESVQHEPTERDDGSFPVDMECHIQTERVTKCLDKLVYQSKLALCIPALMRENIVEDTLTSQHFDDVSYIFDQYDNPLSSQSLMNMAAMEDMQAGDVSLKHRLNPDLGFMMYTLNSYPALKPHVERLIEKMKKDNATKTSGRPDHVSYANKLPMGLKYLQKIEEFRNLMVVQMKSKAAEEISAIIHTRKLEKSNIECLAKIAEHAKCLKEEKEQHDQHMKQKCVLIAQLKKDIKENDHKVFITRKQQILDSERQMVLATRAHAVKYEMLKEEEVESRDFYKSTLKHSLARENQLRDRRRKCEVQLQSWLQKYDTEITAKQTELDELTQQYDDEVENCNTLTRKLEEQDEEYVPLMAEREGEYHEEMTAKLNTFIIEHAARVLQTAWRNTLSNRDEKIKLTKLKHKMDAETEAAAKKAEMEAKKQALLDRKQAKKDRAEAKAAAKAAKLESGNQKKEGEGTPAEAQEEK